MLKDRFSIKIVGPAGYGIKVTGIMLAKVFKRAGFSVFAYTEYPSLIRGGHNTYQVDVAYECHPEWSEGSRRIKTISLISSVSEKCDILVALDAKSIEMEGENLRKNAIVIYDGNVPLKQKNIKTLKNKKINFIPVPFVELAKKAGGEIMKNTVALGALLRLLGMKLDELNDILKDEFADKGKVGEKNVVAAKQGFDFIQKNSNKITKKLEIKNLSQAELRDQKLGNKNLLMTGNQACALGIIASQCQMYVAYPMTPATEILHFLEAKQRQTGMIVHQPEDEIAGIHAALGASFAGARAAVGTSGGGFALMNEALALAGMVELPLVIFEVQRPAPATGNPTWTEQGDLLYVINAGHGEFPKVVIAPGNPEECFKLTQQAFNLADKYQVPVIILSDKFLGESSYTVSRDVFDKIDKVDRGKVISINKKQLTINKNYKRYKIEKDGVSWRTLPGVKNGEYIANSDEHNEYGYSDEGSENRKKMMDKRMQKLEEIRKEIPLPKVYGPQDAEATLVCWGSQLGPALDAIESLKYKNVNIVHFSYLWPLPKNLSKFLSQGLGIKKLILLENNKTGQLGKLIRQETGIEIKDKILKYDSRPFWPEEIVSQLP